MTVLLSILPLSDGAILDANGEPCRSGRFRVVRMTLDSLANGLVRRMR